jgi:HSP20 family protein
MSNANIKTGKQEVERIEKVERTRSGRVYMPLTDIVETRDDIRVYCDMPGVDPRSVDITLENNVLTIEGFVEPEARGDRRLVRGEYEVGDFHRTFSLSDIVDRGRIEASIRNGVLTLRLPKAEPAKAKKIEVRAA